MSTTLIPWGGSPTIYNDNEFWSTGGAYRGVRASTSISSGKVMAEVLVKGFGTSYDTTSVGIANADVTMITSMMFDYAAYEYAYLSDGSLGNSYKSIKSLGVAMSIGSIVGVLIDADNKFIAFSNNGRYLGGVTYTGATNPIMICTRAYYPGTNLLFNFGQYPFKFPFDGYAPYDPNAAIPNYMFTYTPTGRTQGPTDIPSTMVSMPLEPSPKIIIPSNGLLIGPDTAKKISIPSFSVDTGEQIILVRKKRNPAGILAYTLSAPRTVIASPGYVLESISNTSERKQKKKYMINPSTFTHGLTRFNPVNRMEELKTYSSVKKCREIKNITAPLYFSMKDSKSRQNVLIGVLSNTGNALLYSDFKVTPTTTFLESALQVISVNRRYTKGTYILEINKKVAINQVSEVDLTNLVFNIPLDSLSLGTNNCVLKFKYGDTVDYIYFVVTKDPDYRQATKEDFYWYSGGYDIAPTLQIISDSSASSGYQIKAVAGQSGLIVTTDKTSIDCSAAMGIYGLVPDCIDSACLFLVSFDGRNRWYTWNGSSFVTCSLSNIKTSGMNKATLSGIPQDSWDSIFKRTRMDVAIFLDDVTPYPSIQLFYNTLYGNLGIADTADTFVYNVSQEFLVTSMQMVVTSNSTDAWGYAGANGDDISWINGYKYYPTGMFAFDKNGNQVAISPSNGSTWGGSVTIPDGFETTRIRCNVSPNHGFTGPGRGYYAYAKYKYSWLRDLTVHFVPNYPPVITNVQFSPAETHGDSIISFHIADAEGDKAYYKIAVNGVALTTDWQGGSSSEYDAAVNILSKYTTVGTNLVEILTYDGITTSTAYSTYLTKVDKAPNIIGTLDKLKFQAVISDPDNGDTVQYRLSLNGVVKIAWTNLAAAPVKIAYYIKQKDVMLNQQNTITLEAKDNLGLVSSADFDFAGVYYITKRKQAFIL